MNAEQTTGRVWNRRRTEKQRRLAEANMPGKVIPTDQLVSVLENLLAPGDRVVLEGNNQKQADFLSRMLAEVNPQKIHDLHMIMPSVGRSEHLDLFEKGIARKLDFSFSGTQSLRISQLLEDGLLEIGAIHTYIELYSRLYVDLSPNVALIAGYKADRKGNLYTGPSTEDTPALVEAAAFHDGIVIAQVNELVDDECDLPRVDIPGSWIDYVVVADKPFFIEPLFTRDPRLPSCQVPTLVLWGTADKVNRPSGGQALQQRMPDCDLYLFCKTRHWVQWERAEEFNAVVSSYLAARTPR